MLHFYHLVADEMVCAPIIHQNKQGLFSYSASDFKSI